MAPLFSSINIFRKKELKQDKLSNPFSTTDFERIFHVTVGIWAGKAMNKGTGIEYNDSQAKPKNLIKDIVQANHIPYTV